MAQKSILGTRRGARESVPAGNRRHPKPGVCASAEFENITFQTHTCWLESSSSSKPPRRSSPRRFNASVWKTSLSWLLAWMSVSNLSVRYFDMQKRKLQIFLSSTYEDLIDQRLAAMEAILAAGHIPAAMEQFSAGDETALERIQSWIEESDAFVLILGGRYGSIEPVSGKSYVQLEYEFALQKKKPFFAVVVTKEHHEERVRKFRNSAIEDERMASRLSDDRSVFLGLFWRKATLFLISSLITLSGFRPSTCLYLMRFSILK